jgi:hypothetical protein
MTKLLFVITTLLVVGSLDAQMLITSDTFDLMNQRISPVFSLLYDPLAPAARINFPGISSTADSSYVVGGKCEGSFADFSDYYLAGQHRAKKFSVGGYGGKVGYDADKLTNNTIDYDDGDTIQADATDDGTVFTAVAGGWITPTHPFYKGVSCLVTFAGNNSVKESSKTVTGDNPYQSSQSLHDNTTLIAFRGVGMAQVTKTGFLRVGINHTRWSQTSVDDRTSGRFTQNALSNTESQFRTLAASLGYCVVNSYKKYACFFNVGYGRTTGSTYGNLYILPKDTTHGSIEAYLAHTCNWGNLNIYNGLSGTAIAHYANWGRRSTENSSFINAISRRRASITAILRYPVLADLRINSQLSIFAQWHLQCSYTHSYYSDDWIWTKTRFQADNLSIGCRMTVADRLVLSLIPSIERGVFLSGFEARLKF